MGRRRVAYLLCWAGCVVFYFAYRMWFAWITLVAVTLLPLFSLLISLPGLLKVKFQFRLPADILMGETCQLRMKPAGYSALLPWQSRLVVEKPMTGERWTIENGQELPTEHCGGLICRGTKAAVYDCLGLFSRHSRKSMEARLVVRPVPVSVDLLPGFHRNISHSWRPKPGSGFSENHEVRLYRPGDSVQQIHWKLSAKTGKLMLREPMEPAGKRVLIRLVLTGEPDDLDRKLGKLQWIASYLQENNIGFHLECLSGVGKETWFVDHNTNFRHVLDRMMFLPKADTEATWGETEPSGWLYEIGGGEHEE